MGYTIPEDNTRIYVQPGMRTTPEYALKNAQAISQIVKEPVGVIVNGTQGFAKDVEEYLPKAPTLKDALNEYTYQTLNAKGPSLVVLHSAGNEDAKKALQLGEQLGHQYSNLSFLSLGSPISGGVLRSTTNNTNANYLGQVNDWRDPVTYSKTAAIGVIGGGLFDVGLAGLGLFTLNPALLYSGGSMAAGAAGYGIQNIHPLNNYLAKPQTQSIMFNWKSKKKK